MRGVDDGPDGLNDVAFDRALRRATRPRAKQRQFIPVVTTVAPPPSTEPR